MYDSGCNISVCNAVWIRSVPTTPLRIYPRCSGPRWAGTPPAARLEAGRRGTAQYRSASSAVRARIPPRCGFLPTATHPATTEVPASVGTICQHCMRRRSPDAYGRRIGPTPIANTILGYSVSTQTSRHDTYQADGRATGRGAAHDCRRCRKGYKFLELVLLLPIPGTAVDVKTRVSENNERSARLWPFPCGRTVKYGQIGRGYLRSDKQYPPRRMTFPCSTLVYRINTAASTWFLLLVKVF